MIEDRLGNKSEESRGLAKISQRGVALTFVLAPFEFRKCWLAVGAKESADPVQHEGRKKWESSRCLLRASAWGHGEKRAR
jgi:hypothetical protein